MTHLHMKTITPAPPPAASNNRLDLVASIYRAVRSEKDPPLARYAMVLALARRNGKAATGSQIGKDIGQGTAPNGTIDAALRHGLIITGPPTKPGTTTYLLTAEGIALARSLSHPDIHPLA
jgi:hypothetical protein